MRVKEKALREAIVAEGRALNGRGLNVGSAGNISARSGDRMLITPSSVAYDAMRPEMIAAMPIDGEYGAWVGLMKPSTEWRFHLDIMRARPDVGAILHFHPPYGCTLAMLHKPILAAHYLIAIFGGPSIRCTKYAPFGTKELADLVVEGLGDRHAVLLGNHGAVTTAATLAGAVRRAIELENLARMYYMAIIAGRPAILSDEEVARIAERTKSYVDVDAPAPALSIAKAKPARSRKKKAGPRKKAARAAT
jgi:L-fuculose-phosphate aldolase